MNKIEKLLEEFCPQGVEFLALGEVFNIKNGYTPSKIKSEYWTNGTIPWFRMEDIRENGRVLNDSIQHVTPEAVKGGRLFPKNSIIIATSATIGEHALITVPYLSNQRFTALSLKSDINDYFDIKFVFYYIFILAEWCRNNTTTSSFASVDMNGFKKFKIPIPPLTIQKEIVKILDNFTQLEAELEAELEARKKQYEYYRGQLLMVNDKGLMVDGTKVEFRVIGKIVEFVKGASIPRDRTSVDYEVPYLHYGDIYKLYNKEVDVSIEYESIIKVSIDEKVRENQYIHTGDIVYNLTSETKEDLGKAVVIKNDKDCKFIAGTETTVMNIIRKDIINPCFLNYLLMTFSYLNEFRRHTTGTKVFRVHPKAISKISIPIPPLAKQREIVAILDKFDALVNDISTGLPAEIIARKKQYEYYRNQLLNFKPLDAQDAN